MTTLELLKAARALISDPAHWTQRAFGRDATGRPVITGRSAQAVCWCAAGAIQHVTADYRQEARVLDALAGGASLGLIGDTNDWGGHPAVLALYDAAIARLESEAAA
jgi:hypothetical protein